MKADKLMYCERYNDGSGIEYAVEFSSEPYLHDETIIGAISVTHVDTVTLPITKLDWLIDCLELVRQNLASDKAKNQQGQMRGEAVNIMDSKALMDWFCYHTVSSEVRNRNPCWVLYAHELKSLVAGKVLVSAD